MPHLVTQLRHGSLFSPLFLLDQVHVSGAGDFQLCKVELLKDPCPLNARKDGDLMDADEHDVQVRLLP